MVWARIWTRRTWLTWTMVLVLVVSLATWLLTIDRLPATIVIASGEPTGQYFKFAEAFEESLDRQSGRKVKILPTEGSIENRRLLIEGKAHLAIVQAGSISLNEMAVVAPLHRDVVYVVARRNRGIDSIHDLDGKHVIVGPAGSGMRSSGMHVLSHYGLFDRIVDSTVATFDELLTNEQFDAAIITTGLGNPQLRTLLADGRFQLLSVNARAIAAERPSFSRFEIPKGFFSENPVAPPQDVQTVATTALLVVRQDVSSRLVQDSLDALYKEDFATNYPYVIQHDEAANLSPLRLHPVARRYFDPFDRMGWVAAVMESLAATKELLFALGAGLFLFWQRWRRVREKEKATHLMRQKQHLDAYLERTFHIEREQMHLTNVDRLQDLLDQVTRIKLQALQELTHEDLRADQSFSIFLMQCANLISKIQLKIITYRPHQVDA